MFSASLRRTLAGILVAAQLLPSLALASYECTTTTTSSSSGSGLGSVFSVIGDGTVTIHNDDKCSVSFANGNIINTSSDSKYTAPGSTDDKACKDILSGNTVKSSGHSSGSRTLDPYSGSSSDFSIVLTNSDQLKINGHDYGFDSPSSSDRVVIVDGRTFTIPKKGQPFVVPAGEYGRLETNSGQSFSIAGSAKIKSLTCNSSGSVRVAAGTYFIDSIAWQGGCNLSVSGSDTATLNFPTGVTLDSGGSCINFIDCDKLKNSASLTSAASLAIYAEQHPERLQINIYNGNFSASDRTYISAGIYVANGDARLTAASGFVVVGEILAKNIDVSQNNNGVMFYEQSTSMKSTSSTTTVPATSPSFYTMVPPAIPTIATAGTDYGYRAGQINAAAGISGHLKAYLVQSDGNLATTASWDAADKIKDMTDADRRAKMKTLDASGHFTTITALMASDASVRAYGERILNPNADNGKYLAGRDPASLIGRPWKTAPIIVDQSVLFAADDGFLYSIDRTQGTLNWAWMPKEILPLGADPGALMNAHPWGQIATYSVGGKTYVTGSALSGALHFALEVSSTGDELKGNGPLWTDYRAGKSSPASPFGGDAPQMAVLTEGSAAGKLGYIVDNKLVIRMLDGSGTATENALTATATSNLFYYSDSELYFGDSAHHVKQVNSSGVEPVSSGATVMAPNSVDLSITDTIESVSGALVNSASGNSLVLLAQTASRVSTLKRDPAGEWASGWYTAVGSSSDGVSSIDSRMVITAAPMITKSKVLIPITKPGTAAFCAGDEGYNFGPLDLVSGAAATPNVKFNGQDMSSTQLTNKVGDGMATGIVLFTVVASGVSTDIAYASTGLGGAPFTMGQAKTKTRLNWRELTTYF